MKTKAETINWYDNLIFKEENFNFELIRILGQAYYGGADIGECILTARRIKDGDDREWYNSWKATGQRLEEMAKDFEAAGHNTSARTAYFRASSYYRTAGFYLHNPEGVEKALFTWCKSRECFLKAIDSLPDIEPVQIPYEGTTLPGYFLKGRKGPGPTLLLQTGYDGTGEELYFGPGKAAQERGYHCLIFEGPGQGAPIREQGMPFRHDWEKVVTPVVDYAVGREEADSDNIALMGLSMGGYLAPRAAAFEKRIKACVANGGVYEFAVPIYNGMVPENILQVLDTKPDKFNNTVYELMKSNSGTRWFFNNGMFTFCVDTPAEFVKEAKKFTLEGIAEKIKCHMLVIDTEDDLLAAGSAKKLYKHLKCPKTFLLFTREQAAQAHCQSSAMAISSEKMFNWLDDVMDR